MTSPRVGASGTDHLLGLSAAGLSDEANSMRHLDRDPDLKDAVATLGFLVMRRQGSVPLQLKWLVGHVVSSVAGCRYCSAHTATKAATDAGVSIERIESLWEFESSPHFSAAERAALRFAVAAGGVPPSLDDDLRTDLLRHFSEDQVLELVAVVSLYGWFNRWNGMLATPLEAPARDFGERYLGRSGWEPGQHA